MTHQFTAHFAIRQYELNSRGELPNSTIQRLFQETATLAGRDVGLDPRYRADREAVWVIHQMVLEHCCPAHYPDELVITTWLSDVQRVRTHREYLARNAATNVVVARGRAHWVHLSANTLRPLRIPPELLELFARDNFRAVQRVLPRTFPAPHFVFPESHMSRHVYQYEADELKHVNNAIYLDWLEEALANAVAPHISHQRQLRVYRHDIQYTRSAKPGDDVEITVRLKGVGKAASAWELEITNGAGPLVSDHVTALWADDTGHPVPWPERT